MGKINKEEEARRAGMAYAYKIVLDKGVDGLKEELKFRNITRTPLGIKQKDAVAYSNEVRMNCVTTFKLATLLTLADGFDWNTEQLEEFWNVFMNKIDNLLQTDQDDNCFATWADYAEILWDEYKIKINLPEEFLQMGKN